MKISTDTLSVYKEHVYELRSTDTSSSRLANIFSQFFPSNMGTSSEYSDAKLLLNLVTDPEHPYIVSHERLSLILEIENESREIDNGFTHLVNVSHKLFKLTFSSQEVEVADCGYKEIFGAAMIVFGAIAGNARRIYWERAEDILKRNSMQRVIFSVVLEELIDVASACILNEDGSYNHEALMAILDYLALYQVSCGEEETEKLLKRIDIDLLPEMIDVEKLSNFYTKHKYLTSYPGTVKKYKFPFETVAEILNPRVTYGHTRKELTSFAKLETSLILIDMFLDDSKQDNQFYKVYHNILRVTELDNKLKELSEDDDINSIAIAQIDSLTAEQASPIVNEICNLGFKMNFKDTYKYLEQDLGFEQIIEDIIYPTNEEQFMSLAAANLVKHLYYT